MDVATHNAFALHLHCCTSANGPVTHAIQAMRLDPVIPRRHPLIQALRWTLHVLIGAAA